MNGLTRRKFLLVAGGAGAAVALLPVDATPAVAAADPALPPERAAALAAVVAALAIGPAAGRRPQDVSVFVDAFAAHVAAAPPPFQRHAADALDRVAASGLPALPPDAALARLEAWTAGEDPVLAASALALAGLTFDADEDADGRAPGYALSPPEAAA